MIRDRFPSLCCQQENANCTHNIQHSTFNIHQTMLEILENEKLARYTSWKIGGPARFFLNVLTPNELLEALAWSQERGLSVWILGGGTNTLALDSGFDGVVLRYRGHTLALEDQDELGLLRIGAGAPMAGTARRIARQGWAGLEWAEGLPGTIGGAVYGNAGCYGSDIATTLRRAWLLSAGQIVEWSVADFGYSYRSSVLKNERASLEEWGVASGRVEEWETRDTKHETAYGKAEETQNSKLKTTDPPFTIHHSTFTIIIEAEFALQRADPQDLAEIMDRTAAQRRSKTPAGQSCGSVFKNPAGESAGRLIEAAGLKGRRVGAAEIAHKHANYIVNTGAARSDDVLALIDIAREAVLQQFGIELELEVQILR